MCSADSADSALWSADCRQGQVFVEKRFNLRIQPKHANHRYQVGTSKSIFVSVFFKVYGGSKIEGISYFCKLKFNTFFVAMDTLC